MEEKYGYKEAEHQVTIDNREHMEISGVIHVDSFDSEEIILETEMGLLAIRGEDLDIKQLNLEQGKLSIRGFVLELVYSEEKGFKGRGKRFIERLFR